MECYIGQLWNSRLGIWHNGNLYYGESKELGANLFTNSSQFLNSGGLNRTLFKFTVFTNAGINFGGASSSGWEGIAIDQLIFHHNRGTGKWPTTGLQRFQFTTIARINSTDGWLTKQNTNAKSMAMDPKYGT